MVFIRVFLFMLALGAGRGALLAQQHGDPDYLAMIVATLACLALFALRPRWLG